MLLPWSRLYSSTRSSRSDPLAIAFPRAHSTSFAKTSAGAVLRPASSLILFLCFLSFELLCLPAPSPSDFSCEGVKEQLFEQTFCHLIFPFRVKLTVDSRLLKSSSPVSTLDDRRSTSRVAVPVAGRGRSRQTVIHTAVMPCHFTRNDAGAWPAANEGALQVGVWGAWSPPPPQRGLGRSPEKFLKGSIFDARNKHQFHKPSSFSLIDVLLLIDVHAPIC